jgi:SEC-C motif-containing protein
MRAERNFYKALKELKANRPNNKFQARVPATFEQNEPKYVYVQRSKEPYIRPTPKVGRNEPCPCASGKKFKQCCMQNEPNLAQAA